MTITEITAALNEEMNGAFGTDFAGHFDISDDEAERIAERAVSVAEFKEIWENEAWWTDDNQ